MKQKKCAMCPTMIPKGLQKVCSHKCGALWKQAHSKAKPVKPIKKTKRSSDYKKIYWDFFGYDYGDWIDCEIEGCGKPAVDICHIDADGMGGTARIATVYELMAKCREHHVFYGDKKEYKEFLKVRHKQVILNQLKQ